jgi:hypothetical protein
MMTGTVGKGGLSLSDAQEAAKWCGLGLLSTIQVLKELERQTVYTTCERRR